MKPVKGMKVQVDKDNRVGKVESVDQSGRILTVRYDDEIVDVKDKIVTLISSLWDLWLLIRAFFR